MELNASHCSWSWVKVLTSITWCPICCRDMFHKDLSTATESAAILLTAREMMYFTKTKKIFFSICPATHPRKSGTWPLQTTPNPRARRAGLIYLWTQACPEGMCTNGTHRSHARCHPCPIPQPVKVGHTTGVYDPYSFRRLGRFFYVSQEQISKSEVRRDLRFFVLIREDQKV